MANKRKQSRYWTNLRAAEVKIIQYYLDCTDTVVEAAALMQMDVAWVYRKMRDLGIPSPRAAKEAEKPPAASEHDGMTADMASRDEDENTTDDLDLNATDDGEDSGGVVVFPVPDSDPIGDPDDLES